MKIKSAFPFSIASATSAVINPADFANYAKVICRKLIKSWYFRFTKAKELKGFITISHHHQNSSLEED